MDAIDIFDHLCHYGTENNNMEFKYLPKIWKEKNTDQEQYNHH